MKTIPEVQIATTLMNEARAWSVVRWLTEKKKVRRAADLANASLDARHAQLMSAVPPELRRAYDALSNGTRPNAAPDVLRLARQLHDLDLEAAAARARAEATFDEAEKKLSASLAREGCAQAIASWNLHEKANAKWEQGIGSRE